MKNLELGVLNVQEIETGEMRKLNGGNRRPYGPSIEISQETKEKIIFALDIFLELNDDLFPEDSYLKNV